MGLGIAACAGVVATEWPKPTGGRFAPLLVALATTAAVALRRDRGTRLRAVPLALALATSALAGHAAASAPLYSSALFGGRAPYDVYAYAALGAACAAFLAANPLRLADAELGVLALVVFGAGNGKVWGEENELFFPLFGVLAAIAFASSLPRRAPSDAPSGAPSESGTALRVLWPAALAFAAWVAVCGALGENPGRTDEVFGRLLAGLGAGWVAARALDPAGVERVLLASALCGLAGLALFPVLFELVSAVGPHQAFAGTRLRLFGLHPNLTGALVAVQVVLAAALVRRARGTTRALLWVALAACVPALFLSKSRTAWLATVAGLAVLALAERLSRRTWIALGSLGLGVFLAAWLVTPLREAALRTSTSGSSLSQRLYLWDAATRLVAEDPLTGIGVNVYYAHARTGASPSFFDGTDKNLHPHNLLVAVAEGAGIPGVALFLVLLVAALALALRAGSAGAARPALGRAILAAFAALFTANMLDLGLSQVTFVPTLFWILAGCAWALAAHANAGARAPDSAPARSRPSNGRLGAARCAFALAFALLFCARPFGAEALERSGIRLEELEDPGPALAAFERASQLVPWSTSPVARAAQLCARTGKNARARELFARAIALAPTQPRLHQRYANLLANLDRLDEAQGELRTALALDPHGPDESEMRLAYAELLGRSGDRAGARAEAERALLADSVLPERFAEQGFRLPVAGQPPLELREVALELAAHAADGAAERPIFEVRRKGDRLARLLRQMGRGEDALALLAAFEEALGFADTSLRRAELEIREELGLVTQTRELAERALDSEGLVVDKGAIGFVENTPPREVIEKCARDLTVPLDPFFDSSVLRDVLRRTWKAHLALGDLERAQDALEGALFFCEEELRADDLAAWAEALAARGRAAQSLAVVREALDDCDALEHSATRAQKVMRLVQAALAAASAQRPQATPRERLDLFLDVVPTRERGASARLYRILGHLSLAEGDGMPFARAEELYRELQARFPAEGVAIGRFLEAAR